VTGCTRRFACLVAYAIFGPPSAVLGPDSSVSPLILAPSTPLIVAGRSGSAIALAGCWPPVVSSRSSRLAKLGFVADLLSSEVRVATSTAWPSHHRGSAAETVRLLHRRRWSWTRSAPSSGTSTRRTGPPCHGPRSLACCWCYSITTRRRRLVACRRHITRRVGLGRSRQHRRHTSSGSDPSLPWTSWSDLGP